MSTGSTRKAGTRANFSSLNSQIQLSTARNNFSHSSQDLSILSASCPNISNSRCSPLKTIWRNKSCVNVSQGFSNLPPITWKVSSIFSENTRRLLSSPNPEAVEEKDPLYRPRVSQVDSEDNRMKRRSLLTEKKTTEDPILASMRHQDSDSSNEPEKQKPVKLLLLKFEKASQKLNKTVGFSNMKKNEKRETNLNALTPLLASTFRKRGSCQM